MSDTPRTEGEVEIAKKFPATSHGLWISAEFARILEREVDEAQRELAALRADLARSKNGECLKCGIGPRRETCAYPEACEHPGRVTALELNQALLDLVAALALLADFEAAHPFGKLGERYRALKAKMDREIHDD
jgi:hypothetical protein